MPTVHTQPLVRAVDLVRREHLVQTEIRTGVPVVPAADVEIPGTAEIVLSSGTADGRELGVPVQVELPLPLAPPTRRPRSDRQIRPHITAVTADTVQNGVY